MQGLKPRTTYYYKVAARRSIDKSDGVKSTVKQFTTPTPTSESWLTLNAIEVRGRGRGPVSFDTVTEDNKPDAP
jgi:hypothetical protein